MELTVRDKPGANNPPPLRDQLLEKHDPIFKRLKAWKKRAAAAESHEPKTVEDCAILERIFADGRDIANDAEAIRVREKEPFQEGVKAVDGLFNGEVRDEIGAGIKGGLAQKLVDRAAAVRLALTRAQQAEAAKAAEKAAREADRLAEVAQRQEERGQHHMADVSNAKADAAAEVADRLAAQAAAPVAAASKTTIGGVTASASAKRECTGVVRAELDLEVLRGYFKQEDLVAAVNAALRIDQTFTCKGAAIEEKAVGRVSRR